MANRWIVTALGQDRPGIVAGVTQALYRLGCNLEDSAMKRLEGEFAIMLIFAAPPSVTADRLSRALTPLERQLGLAVHLKRLTTSETKAPRRRSRAYMMSVYGADRPGIVFRISELLASQGINISDVQTHRSETRLHASGQPSLYLLLLEVELSSRYSVGSLQRRLVRLAKQLRVEISLKPADADVL